MLKGRGLLCEVCVLELGVHFLGLSLPGCFNFFHFISPSTSKPAGCLRHWDLWQLHFFSLLPRARMRQVMCLEHKTPRGASCPSDSFRLCLRCLACLMLVPALILLTSQVLVLTSLPAYEFILWNINYRPEGRAGVVRGMNIIANK